MSFLHNTPSQDKQTPASAKAQLLAQLHWLTHDDVESMTRYLSQIHLVVCLKRCEVLPEHDSAAVHLDQDSLRQQRLHSNNDFGSDTAAGP